MDFEVPQWTFTYKIAPPQNEQTMRRIAQILDEERASARLVGRAWSGELKFEPRKTDLVIVSDSSDQNCDIYLRLESELKQMGAEFYVTTPRKASRD